MELFGTAGIRGDVTETVTPELALAVGRAVAVDAASSPTVAVGWDGRVTSQTLAAAVTAGLQSGGADVRQVGRCPTPALAFASRRRRGVMITASHNPPTDNGIKCFVDGVEYDRSAERRIESLVADDGPPSTWSEWGSTETEDVLDNYRDAIVEYARSMTEGDARPLAGLRIVIDCGNGVSADATPDVLRELGATPVTLHANVDGHFPGRESKPTPESLATLRSFVEQDPEAAFGIGHDGDGDRIVIVGPDGDVVHEDTVLAILADHYVASATCPEPVVVTTPNASGRIDERVRAAGGRTERVALGQLHEGIEQYDGTDGSVVFAGEPWKHVHPSFGGWIDAIASAAVFAVLVGDADDVDTLRAPVTERPYRKVSVRCPDSRKAPVMEKLRSALPEQFADGSVDTEYGVRIDRPDGSWLLVRPSGTEPYIRLYAESEEVEELVAAAEDSIRAAVEQSTEL